MGDGDTAHSTRAIFFAILLTLLLVVLPATAAVGMAQTDTPEDTSGDSGSDAADGEEEQAEEEEEESSDDGEEGDGSTPQVSFFEESDEEPAIMPDDAEEGSSGSGESEGEDSSGTGSEGDTNSGSATMGNLAGDGGGGGNGSGEGDDYSMFGGVPDPGDVTDAIITRIAALLYAGMAAMIDDVFNEMLGTPVPENNGYQGILGHPDSDGGTFASVYHDFYLPKIIAPIRTVIPLMLAFNYFFVWPAKPLLGQGQTVTKDLLKYAAGAAIIIVSWEIASFILFAADAGTQWLLPDSEDLLNSPESGDGIGTLESTSGPVGALLGITFFGWNAGIALLGMQGARQILLTGFPAVLGIVFILQFFGPQRVRQFGSVGFWGSIGLVVMNIPTAFVLGFAHAVAFDFGMGGASGTLANAGVTMGLFAIAVFLPIITQATFLAAPMFMIITGRGTPGRAGASYISKKTGLGSSSKESRWGGGYFNSSSNYSNESKPAQKDTQARRNAAVTDGGQTTTAPTQANQRTYTSTARYSPRSVVSTGKPAPDPSPSTDQRRMERYRSVKDGYRATK